MVQLITEKSDWRIYLADEVTRSDPVKDTFPFTSHFERKIIIAKVVT